MRRGQVPACVYELGAIAGIVLKLVHQNETEVKNYAVAGAVCKRSCDLENRGQFSSATCCTDSNHLNFM